VWDSSSFSHVFMIHAQFIQSHMEFLLFNVYAPCDNNAKLEVWDWLSGRLQQLGGQKVCLCGDFNVVRCDAERHSVRQGGVSND
jgi:exonuclease III